MKYCWWKLCPIKINIRITYFQALNHKLVLVLMISHNETVDLCRCATLLKFLSFNHWHDKVYYTSRLLCCPQLQIVHHMSICTTLLIKIKFRISFSSQEYWVLRNTRWYKNSLLFDGKITLMTHKTHVCSSYVLLY